MTMPVVRTLSSSTDCPYSEGSGRQTPLAVYNRPGLTLLARRVGTALEFKRTLLERLSQSQQPALRLLTTRNDDDFTIALLDAWAVVADVLTFYQERIANESYLRTASERQSLLGLARLIGYELAPGVAASTCMAFTLDEAPTPPSGGVPPDPTAPRSTVPAVTVEKGAKIQSVPGPGEQAQIFETVETIVAHAGLHQIRPRLTRPQEVSPHMDDVVVSGAAANQSPGDLLLISMDPDTPDGLQIGTVLDLLNDPTADRKWGIRIVTGVTPEADNQRTWIHLHTLGDCRAVGDRQDGDSTPTTIDDFWKDANLDEKTRLDNEIIEEIRVGSWEQADLLAVLRMKGWSAADCIANLNRRSLAITANPEKGRVFAFRTRAAFFGYNAPLSVSYSGSPPSPTFAEWPLAENPSEIFLDNVYEGIAPESLVLIRKDKGVQLNRVRRAEVRYRTAYGISSKTTWLELDQPLCAWDSNKDALLSAVRDVVVYVQSEELLLAPVPMAEELGKEKRMVLDRCYEGLTEGKEVIVTGQAKDLAGVFTGEVATVRSLRVNRGLSELIFEKALTHQYLRRTVTVHGNVVPATHGETVQEVLGSGDATQSFQRFTLRQRPLTYTSAATPGGAETTLKVRVNDVLWREVPTLNGQEANARIYVTRRDDDGRTTVIFGDGKTGARLPTGRENIRAEYRKGIGLGGLVKANQLSQLMTRPLGVKSATNPLASDGAAAPESLSQVRRNAPVTVLTLSRIVSLQDYEDFARTFAGIDKALATWDYEGTARAVFLTVAGAEGRAVAKDSRLYRDLNEALHGAGNPRLPVYVASYEPRFFQVRAKIRVDEDYLVARVLPAVEEQLRLSFSFHARCFGQGVTLSEVISTMQQVPGVKAVDLEEFFYSEESQDQRPSEPPSYLTSATAYVVKGELIGAELLTLDSRPVVLKEMTDEL